MDSDREQDEVAKVIKKKDGYFKNYHSHRPSLAMGDEQMLFPTENKIMSYEYMRVSSVTSNVEAEGDINSSSKGMRKHIKTNSYHFETNDSNL